MFENLNKYHMEITTLFYQSTQKSTILTHFIPRTLPKKHKLKLKKNYYSITRPEDMSPSKLPNHLKHKKKNQEVSI